MGRLIVHPEKCTGCRVCELICSFTFEGEIRPAVARVHVFENVENGIDLPIMCVQCKNPLCRSVCPVKAIQKNTETGLVVIDQKCIGCGECVAVCPFDAIMMSPERKTFKCQLCDGDPQCAKYCPTGAIEFAPITRESLQKRKEWTTSILKTRGFSKRHMEEVLKRS